MDYINRDVAIEAITKAARKKFTLADWYEFYLEGMTDAEDSLKALPAADVVEVIRCKDCKYFNLNKWGEVNDIPLIVAHEICDFWGEGCKTNIDAYCLFAKRRESCAR